MHGHKFRLVFETKTKKGYKVQLKFNVPPSKHLGLINFLKIALEHNNDVEFTVEKIANDKKELSKIKGNFHLIEEKKEDEVSSTPSTSNSSSPSSSSTSPSPSSSSPKK
jgi:hypothetical protein